MEQYMIQVDFEGWQYEYLVERITGPDDAVFIIVQLKDRSVSRLYPDLDKPRIGFSVYSNIEGVPNREELVCYGEHAVDELANFDKYMDRAVGHIEMGIAGLEGISCN
jgi:hypothetical protein